MQDLTGNRRTYTNDSLADHDTDNLEIGHRSDPVVRAGSRTLTPAIRPNSLEKGLEVTNGEEDVTFKTETSTRNDGMAEVP
jgi:hypothetical protein